MTISTINYDIAKDEDDTAEIPLAFIQSALSYQMTRYSLRANALTSECPGCIARNVVQHLETLVAHQQVVDNHGLRLAYGALLIDWRRIMEKHGASHSSAKSQQSSKPRLARSVRKLH